MRSIETTATVTSEDTLTVAISRDIPLGPHRVVVVIHEQPLDGRRPALLDFPVDDLHPWPDNLSLRRKEMYDERGR